MKKILLIDDLALKGWKSVIEKAVIKTIGVLDIATSFEQAKKKIEDKYDIIFLDVRLTEEDHSVLDVKQYSGFKILKEIKQDFLKINFSTPIILITASNKIWNIDAFRNYGVDAYYIKEHPNYIFGKENSLQNLEILQESFLTLIETSSKRNQIWEHCSYAIELINKHYYFKDLDSRYLNVKNRIIDKLKLGYSHLFKNQTEIEKELLLSNNESLSFIIFFSILEEISKGFTDISETWDKLNNRNGYWKFRNKEYFIEYDRKKDILKVNNETCNEKEFHKFYNGTIYLSEQIYALFYAYSKGEKKNQLDKAFKEINKFRNETDYIHSSIENIFSKRIITKSSLNDAFNMNLNVLKLINNILELETK